LCQTKSLVRQSGLNHLVTNAFENLAVTSRTAAASSTNNIVPVPSGGASLRSNVQRRFRTGLDQREVDFESCVFRVDPASAVGY
jgi:hypothetical protein